MSKNDQMSMSRELIIGAERATTGPGGIAQGIYGERGNLELVVPDRTDGIWVFWFNSDAPAALEGTADGVDTGAPSDVPPGSWSAGLLFASGRAYREASIVQSPLGPDHLEVIALTVDGELESWFWSPGPGFVRREMRIAAGVSDYVAEILADGTLRVGVTDAADYAEGQRTYEAGPEGYPERTWRESATTVTDMRAAALAALLDAGVRVQKVVDGTVRSALSTRDGGTREIVYRHRDGSLRHLAVPVSE